MVTLSSLTISSNPIMFRVQPFRSQLCHFHRRSKSYFPRHTFYTNTTLIKSSMADHNEPNEVRMQIGIMMEKLREAMPKLREAMPSPVQEFPWRNAQHTLLGRLHLVQEASFKWSLVVYFILSSLSDVVYTFSINRELIIPAGLFVGCLMADFLKEISLELIRGTEENDLKLRRLVLCGFFLLVKITPKWFSTQPGVFLLHVANGGLMQLLWHWRNFIEDAKNRQEMSTPSGLEA